VRGFLDSRQAAYTLTTLPRAYTAREVATAEPLPAREVAKTVVILGDGAYCMIMIPASRLVDLHEVRTGLTSSRSGWLRKTSWRGLFPDCELGALPPLGPLYYNPVYLDGMPAVQNTVAFNAGTHYDVIHVQTAEFRRPALPQIVPLAREPAASQGWCSGEREI